MVVSERAVESVTGERVLAVRSAALHGYVSVAKSVGLDPDEMLARAGFNGELQEDPNRPIPISALSALMEESALQSGQRSFGLMLCEARTFGSLGPLALLLAQDSSCREVIDHVIRFQTLLGDSAIYSLEPRNNHFVFRTELRGGVAGPQLREAQMGLVSRLMRDWLHLPWAPESVHFVHSAPMSLAAHSRIFQCPLVFDSAFNGFVCTPAMLEGTRNGGDPELAAEALRIVDQIMGPAGDLSLEERVRRAVRLRLSSGGATLEQVAWSMDLKPRKLQRLLEEGSTSFRELLNAVRRDLASELLSNPHHSITSVAFLLGFATPTAFTRWFKEQFGEAPSGWRTKD